MTDADQKLLHVALLQVARAAGDLGRTETLLVNDVRMAGFALDLAALQVELRALADKGWLSSMAPELGAKRWRLTARGRSQLEEAGL
jgi:hypothetical protein